MTVSKISREEMGMLLKDEELAKKLYLLNVVSSWISTRVLNRLLKAGPRGIGQISQETNLSTSDVLDILKELESAGIVECNFNEKERMKYWSVKNGGFKISLQGDNSGIHIGHSPIDKPSFLNRLLNPRKTSVNNE